MTKTLKLTDDFLDSMNGEKCVNGKAFFTHDDPPRSEGEGFKPKDIAKDNTKVPIYLNGNIIRYEGSNATPPTADIVNYGCDKGETMKMPNALADRWLAKKIPVKNTVGQITLKNVLLEV